MDEFLQLFILAIITLCIWGPIIWVVSRMLKFNNEVKKIQIDGLTRIIKTQNQQTKVLEQILEKIDKDPPTP